MICKNCGADVTGKFCNECGNPLIDDENNSVTSCETDEKSKKEENTKTYIEEANYEEVFENVNIDTPKKKKGKKGRVIAIVLTAVFLISGAIFAVYELTKECEHVWEAATVSTPKTCKNCGETEGDPLTAIPDVKGLDEQTAKTLIVGKGFIPRVEYEYDDEVEEGQVIRTSPRIGSGANIDDVITIYMSKGASYYLLNDAVGYMYDVYGIQSFSWENPETKGFYNPYYDEGNLCIEMYLNCKSTSKLAFYKNFGTASINDTFDKTVPIEIIYEDKNVNNKGERTYFTAKIPLSDLGVQKPTNIYLQFDFLVNGVRQTFRAGFDLSW